MRKLLVVGLVVLLAAGIAGTRSTQAISYPVSPVYGITCNGITQSNGSASVLWDRDTAAGGQNTENLKYLVTDGAGKVLFSFDDIRSVGSTANPVGFSYTAAPDFNPIRLLLTSPAGNGLPEQVLFDLTGECAGLPSVIPMPEPDETEPGCDVLVPIPDTAVGGTFVADAPVYWKPGQLVEPGVTITAGNSARVIGLDASGEYYQILWVCDFLWVPANTLGPNYDAVWNGAPLPTGVVESSVEESGDEE